LYFTNTARNVDSIYRFDALGTRLETVVTKADSAGVTVFCEMGDCSMDTVYYTESTKAAAYYTTIPLMVDSIYTDAVVTPSKSVTDSIDTKACICAHESIENSVCYQSILNATTGASRVSVPVAVFSTAIPTDITIDSGRSSDDFMFITLSNGIIARVSKTCSVIDAISVNAAGSTAPVQYPRITDSSRTQYQSVLTGTGLPVGSDIIFRSSMNSRLTTLCSIPRDAFGTQPFIESTTNDTYASLWIQQRIFALDTNRQTVYSVSDSGTDTSSLDLSAAAGFGLNAIVWPRACTFAKNYETTSTQIAASGLTNRRVDMYIAEYLGKIWRLRIELDEDQKAQPTSLAAPTLIADFSNYAASNRIRELITASVKAGGSATDAVNFEIST
jgi:hypothetical protein